VAPPSSAARTAPVAGDELPMMTAGPNRLAGKIAIITGAARGIGEATARRLVSEGARIVIADVLAEEGSALAETLGEHAAFAPLDVSVREQWDAVVDVAHLRFGPVNVLVNNAGITMVRDLPSLRGEDLRRITEINQFGPIYGMQAVFQDMASHAGGSIVNTSSIAAVRGWGSNVAYAATKGAILAASRTVAIEWAEHGIRVNTVLPGVIDTVMGRGGVAPELSNLAARVADQVPLKRAGRAEEVAAAIAYLASDESGFCTGLELVIDGGQIIGRRRRTTAPANSPGVA
jgi:3alpha(or 20beta)-hydroxysteroid dehydrogenase